MDIAGRLLHSTGNPLASRREVESSTLGRPRQAKQPEQSAAIDTSEDVHH